MRYSVAFPCPTCGAGRGTACFGRGMVARAAPHIARPHGGEVGSRPAAQFTAESPTEPGIALPQCPRGLATPEEAFFVGRAQGLLVAAEIIGLLLDRPYLTPEDVHRTMQALREASEVI